MDHLVDHNYILPCMNNNEYHNDHNYILPFPQENIHLNEVDLDDARSDEEMDENDVPVANAFQGQTAVSYTTLPGLQLKSKLYMDNLGYIYYKCGSHNNKIYLVCQNQRNRTVFCPSTAKISGDLNEHWIKTKGIHNHIPPVVDIPKAHFKRNIAIAGTSSGKSSIREIYNNEIVLNPEGARNYTFLQCQSSIRRMRHSRRPLNQEIIEELVDNILNQ